MHVRRNVYSLSPTGPEIASLRAGVGKMKDTTAFPATDPRSWRFQANIHGNFGPPQPAWNQCQHGSFFFLSWHRMYLYWFERILRAASGDPNLALPYWRWNDPDPAKRALPIAFRQPASASNPLYESRRAPARPSLGMPAINAGAQLPLSLVRTAEALSLTNFTSPFGSVLPSFGGQTVSQPVHLRRPHGALEGSPHDVIHGLVGGPGGGPTDPNRAWMSWPQTAARDPIFWLHHAMIDRVWKVWLRMREGRQNPVGNSVWMNTTFRFFDESGAQVTMSGRDILNTVTQLDYRYDDDPPGGISVRVPFFVPEAELAATAQSNDGTDPTLLGESVVVGEGMIELGAAPKRVALQLRDEATERVAAVARAEVVPLEERIVLNVEGVQYYDQNPGVAYEVYLNLPEGQEPDFQSDYYVGNIGFFGMETYEAEEGGHGGHPADLSFDVTDVVRALRERGEWREEEATVTFVMRGLEPPEEEAQSWRLYAEGFAEQEREVPGRPRVERVTIITGG
jgi:hypothetical protein